jgi:cytochrome c553
MPSRRPSGKPNITEPGEAIRGRRRFRVPGHPPGVIKGGFSSMHHHRRSVSGGASPFGQLAAAIATAAALTLTAAGADAASAEAGKAKAEPCMACHGENGISVADDIPNLAGQKTKYIETQLKAFKAGKRKNALMNAVAPQLSDAEIADLAAFFSGLDSDGGAKSPFSVKVAKTNVTFPEDYKKTYTLYHTINFPDRNQVRDYFASPEVVAAAKAGKPIPNGGMVFVEVHNAKLEGGKPAVGGDGFFVRDKLALFTAMAKGDGWGMDIPEILRNGDWHYAVFSADKKRRDTTNQATCLACHKPLASDDYLFTLKKIKAKAK